MPEIDFSGLPDKELVEAPVLDVPAVDAPVFDISVPETPTPEGVDFSGLPDKVQPFTIEESLERVGKLTPPPYRLPEYSKIKDQLPPGMAKHEQSIKNALTLAATYDITPSDTFRMEKEFKEKLKDNNLWDTAQKSLKRGLGNTYTSMGNALKWAGMDGDFAETYIDFGERLQLAYPRKEDTEEFHRGKLLDLEYLATVLPENVPFMLSLVPAAIVGAYGGTAAAGVIGAARLGRYGKIILQSIGGSLLSRPIESAFNAGNVYDESLKRGDAEEEATRIADEVFWKDNYLLGLDAAQLAVAFTPLRFGKGMKYPMMKRIASVGGKAAFVTGTEGGEERWQEFVDIEALGGEADFFDLDNPRLNEATAIGGIFGLGMAGTGSVFNALTRKTTEGLSEDLKNTYDTVKADAVGQGIDEQQATLAALDAIAETPEGKAHIESTVQNLKEMTEGVAPPVEEAPEIAPEPIPPTLEEAIERIITEDVTEEEIIEITETFAAGREIIGEEAITGEDIVTAPAKLDPWEMTKDEWVEIAKKGKKRIATGKELPAEAEAKTPIRMGEINQYLPEDIAHFYLRRRTTPSGVTHEDVAHEEYLRDAIFEGKPVSEEVLKPYSDLKGRGVVEEITETVEVVEEVVKEKIEEYYAKEYEGKQLESQIATSAVADAMQVESSSDISTVEGKIPVGGGVRTLGVGITANLIKKGRVDLRGTKAESAEDIAALSQIFRNPQFETFRFIYVKDGAVVGHEGVTSRLPGQVTVFADDPAKAISKMKSRISRLKADSVWMVHNHPSGDPQPSHADVSLTHKLMKKVPQIQGHIVVNSNKYANIMRSAGGTYFSDILSIKTDEAAMQSYVDHPLLGKKIESQENVVDYALSIKASAEFITVFYRDSSGRIRAIQEIPVGMLKNKKGLTDYLRGRAREFGSPEVILAGQPLGPSETETVKDVIKEGNIIDFVEHGGISHRLTTGVITDPSQWMGREIGVGERVAEDGKPTPHIKNIRQLAKSLGGIDFNREHMKGELRKLQEDAPGVKFIVNKKGQGVTLDDLLTSAIDEGILDQDATLNDLLSALEINLETPSAMEDRLFEEEMREREKEGKAIAKEEKEKLRLVRQRLKEAVVTPRKRPVKTRVREITGQVKDTELLALREEIKRTARIAREAYRAGKEDVVKRETQKLKNILLRSRKVRIVRDYLNLTDADMKKLTTKNPLFMDQWEFKQFIDDLRVRAVELSENKLQKAMLIHQIYEKDLSKVDNYRKVLGFPTITKMTTEQAREFAVALDQFADGSSFLTVRQLQLIDRTELEGARTYDEAKKILSEKTGLSIEDLSKISITEWTKFKWDTALAESDPFLNLLVRGVNEKLLEANIRAFDIETKVHKLAKKSEKSRARTFLEKIIPQDKLIFEYLETPIDEKEAVMANMTKEQIDLAHYMQEYFANALEYLIQVKGLEQGRANYITHVRRGMLENIKEEGLSAAVSSMFTAMQEDYATFNIGTDQRILPLDKFFQYEMRRTGVIEPSKNVINVFLHYVKTFEKMVSLNEIMPVMDIYAQSITPQIYTPKGLEMDKSIKNFVHDYINNKKGRRITAAVIDKQGGVVDILLRAGKTLTSFRDLGWNIFSGLAATGGEQIANYQMLGTKKFAKGNTRMSTKKGKAILEKYAAVIGRSSWEGMFAPGENIIDRTMTSAFALFNEASRLANKQFILGFITDAEYNSGEITSERMTEVLLDMGRFRVVPGTKSLVGSTSLGGTMTQYKTWAVPVLRTNLKNLIDTAKNLKTKPVGEALTQREAIEIYRLVGVTLTAYMVWAMVGADEEDDSFAGQLLNKVKRETFTLIQAVDPTLFFGDPRLSSFLQKLAKNIKMCLFLEEYKTKPGLKGVAGLKRQFTPRAITQFQGKAKKPGQR